MYSEDLTSALVFREEGKIVGDLHEVGIGFLKSSFF